MKRNSSSLHDITNAELQTKLSEVKQMELQQSLSLREDFHHSSNVEKVI